ncbi:MAG: thermonuclease family protein [Candidatus Aenigmatarchaeota archaeon]
MRKLIRNQIVILPFLIMLVIMSIAETDASQSLRGRVMQVKDGDTVVVSPLEGGQFFVCRLYGIDAPETPHKNKPGQPYGEEATAYLKKLILGQTVEVEKTGAKTYNREVCLIRKDGRDINLEMVKAGYAWAYRQYLRRPYASEYIEAENEARARRLGLWQQVNPQPPWEFRKRMSRLEQEKF